MTCWHLERQLHPFTRNAISCSRTLTHVNPSALKKLRHWCKPSTSSRALADKREGTVSILCLF